jgi:hypothetical protein
MRTRVVPLLLALIVGSIAFTSAQTKTPPAQGAAAKPPAPTMKGPVAPPTTDDAKIKSAMSAAPLAIAQNATIVDMNEKMEMRTLKAGTNGWTCMPDLPTSPGADPMCLDKNGMEWAGAWMSHKDPPAGKMGIGYMLVGGSDASNTDPFATAPAPNGKWIDTGPHIMVLNIGNSFAGYPTVATNTKVPYVMYSGTPYAHLMIPVK